MIRFGGWVSFPVVLLAVGLAGAAEGEKKGRLRLVEAVPRDDLDGVVDAVVSPDGKFLYSASWKGGAVGVFARDPKTGKLDHKQTVKDDLLAGSTAVCLSPDGRFALASAFQARTAVLYTRNPETGELTQSDVARDGEKDVKFTWPTHAAFSTDGKHVYVLDDHTDSNNLTAGAVVAFRISDGKLQFVAADQKDSLAGARGIAAHPDGKTLLVACHQAGKLVVCDRDKETGKTSVRQVIGDEEGEVHGLDGAMGVAVSPDGRSVYVSAGRFNGDQALSVFNYGTDGRLTFVQEFFNERGDVVGFGGGNHLTVSPDGRNVYAAATLSHALVCFAREPDSGKLTFLETHADGGDGPGDAGAAGVVVSPDGRFTYVATEDGKALSVFERNPAP